MCLAKAYLGGNSDSELLAEEVTSVKVNDGKLEVATLFGEKREIAASIKEIDFRASRILLEKTPGGN
jgi:predicted RNA-binding protein